MSKDKLILGIDPGLAITGWSVLQVPARGWSISGGKSSKPASPVGGLKVKCWGTIRTATKLDLGERLEKIYQESSKLIEKHRPETAAVEKLYFGKNAKTAMVVGQARGAIILACQQKGLEIKEYTPLEIKVAICGYGRANKVQVQRMVQKLLNLKEIPKPDDAADAIAVGYVAGISNKYMRQ